MRSFSVVPDEPGDQLAIELIGSDQQLLMVINELLLNGPVKTFEVGVHLGSSGIGMPASSQGSIAPQQERRSLSASRAVSPGYSNSVLHTWQRCNTPLL